MTQASCTATATLSTQAQTRATQNRSSTDASRRLRERPIALAAGTSGANDDGITLRCDLSCCPNEDLPTTPTASIGAARTNASTPTAAADDKVFHFKAKSEREAAGGAAWEIESLAARCSIKRDTRLCASQGSKAEEDWVDWFHDPSRGVKCEVVNLAEMVALAHPSGIALLHQQALQACGHFALQTAKFDFCGMPLKESLGRTGGLGKGAWRCSSGV
jgi:hypothetical protein